MIKVESIEHLKELCNNYNEFFINLGVFRSSKHIEYDGEDIWYIFNEIDNTEQSIGTKQLFDKEFSNIGEAINKGNFYCYE